MIKPDYKEALHNIKQRDNWENTEAFFIDAIIKGSISLIDDCYMDIKNNNILRIFPIIRQVHENCLIIFGLGTKVITATNFISGKIDYKNIISKAAKLEDTTELAKEQSIIVDNYLKEIKKILNKYSHSNFDGVMQLYLEEYQVLEVLSFNKLMATITLQLVESVFIVLVNSFYSTNIGFPNIKRNVKELKSIKNLKYIKDRLPENIRNYIVNNDIINEHLQKMFDQIKSITLDSIFKAR